MKIVEQRATAQVEVAYQATDDAGDYTYMHTYAVPGTLPAVGTKDRTAWDAARLAEQEAQYAAWRTIMDTPIPEPTKADVELQLAARQRDKLVAETEIAKLSAKLAVFDAAVIVEKSVG
jgi:hypothetical protein